MEIQRSAGNDTQVKCSLAGNILPESYSFNEIDYNDAMIETYIREDLIVKGYNING